MIDHVNALVLPVEDVARCAAFYRDALGFRLAQLEDDEAYLTVGEPGGFVLALKSLPLAAESLGVDRLQAVPAGGKRPFLVTFVDDLDALHADLVAKGVRFLRPPTTQEGGWRTAHVADPEGNLWELSQRPPR